MEEQKNNKQKLSEELDNEEKKVVKQEINEDDLEVSAGVKKDFCKGHCVVVSHKGTFSCDSFSLH